jgi:hypothetical protein
MKERKGSEIGRKATILVKNTGRLVDLEWKDTQKIIKDICQLQRI